ncbi:hypothetical protein FPV67DRAFT_296016 [Lyophyllum atratum]|nr:hypothetical protein FPV67DRAFT_296016 [Lyophyllum atratum]
MATDGSGSDALSAIGRSDGLTVHSSAAHAEQAIRLDGEENDSDTPSMFQSSNDPRPQLTAELVECNALVVELPLGHRTLAGALADAAEEHFNVCDRTDNLWNLNMAVTFYEAAIDGSHPSDSGTPSYCQNEVVEVYEARFARLGSLGDIESALNITKILDEKMPMPSADEPRSSYLQSRLCTFYLGRYCRLGRLEDLEASLSCSEAALSSIHREDSSYPHRLGNLALIRGKIHLRFGAVDDIHASVEYHKAAVDAIDILAADYYPDGPDLARRQSHLNLASSYIHRFDRFGQLDDLEASLSLMKIVSEVQPPRHRKCSQRQACLAEIYIRRFQRFGTLDDLEAAIRHRKAAMACLPEGHPLRALHQAGLGTAYTLRYQRLKAPVDLEAAFLYATAALIATPEDHPRLPDCYDLLSVCHQNLYLQGGHGVYPHVDAEPVEPEKAGLVSDKILANDPQSFFDERNPGIPSLDGLQNALQNAEASQLDSTPRSHSDLAHCQRHRTELHVLGHVELGEKDHLKAALEYAKAAVDDTPADHPQLPKYQATLAMAYHKRYQRTAVVDDLEAAFFYWRAAVDNTPSDHPALAERQSGLAEIYTIRYDRFGRQEDLGAAQHYSPSARDGTPLDHPDLPERRDKLEKLIGS